MNKEKSNSQLAGMVCGGCLFIGMGIGWAMGSLKAGLFIGLGVGLLAMALVQLGMRHKP
jgi:mannose/fructose/N-acetylgalactosamine-specific phosphotransferase system component IIC